MQQKQEFKNHVAASNINFKTDENYAHVHAHACDDDEKPDAALDDILVSAVDEIWNKYDDDRNGYLDKAEVYKMLIEPLAKLHDPKMEYKEAKAKYSHYLTEEEFEIFYQ